MIKFLIPGVASLLLVLYIAPVVDCKCPSPWKEYNNTCYLFTVNRFRFNDALLICTNRNASIYVPHSEDEIQWVTNYTQNGARILYWVGLRLANSTWQWEDGTQYTVNSTHWFRNKEGNKKDRSNTCAAVYAYKPDLGHVQARRCTDSWGTICTKPNDAIDLCNADDGWVLIEQKCIKLFPDKENWFNARKTCQSNGGDLYVPQNTRETFALYDLTTCRSANDSSWIGVTDIGRPGYFLNATNQTMRYQPWYSYGRTILTRGGTCAYANALSNYYWVSDYCTSIHPFICSRPQGVCPDGWYNKDDHCYQINDIQTAQSTWFLANKFCTDQGTDLLTLDNPEEEAMIQSILSSQKIQRAWLGMSDLMTPNIYQWANTTAVANGYTNWDRGFPKQHGTKTVTCGIIQIGASSSTWSAGYCYNSMPFVCKSKLLKTLTLPTPPPPQYHCDAGWKSFGQYCYYFGESQNSTGYTWSDAQHYCWSQQSKLVSIKTPLEQSFITENQAQKSTAWTGLKYSAVRKVLVWSDDQTTVKFQSFLPGEPDDISHGEWCIRIVGGRQDYTGGWDDSNCTDTYDVICKKPAYPGGPSATPPPATTVGGWSYRCGPSWIYNAQEGYCYWVITDSRKTWTDAQWDCNQKGGNLASITGPREQSFIQALISSGGVQSNYWIGATDSNQEGGWEWIDKSPFAYLHWHEGEPNEFGVGEDCTEIVPAWEYQWNDKRCDKINSYVCKKTALPMSTSPGSPTVKAPVVCNMEPMISGNYSLLDSTGLSASSERTQTNIAASSRYYKGSLGGWSAQQSNTNQYIQATFYNVVVMKGITTAGRSDADEWITSFKLMYRYDTYSEWVYYEEPPGTVKIFIGNVDSTTAKTNAIQFPVEAKSLKLIPVKWQNGISLRWEILGCIEEFCRPDYSVSGPLVINDTAMAASSTSDQYHSAASARLHPITSNGQLSCWRPGQSVSNQWLMMDLGTTMIIRGVTTAGNHDGLEWVSSYKVTYNLQGLHQAWSYYQEPFGTTKVFQGNTNNTDMVTHFFKGHFQARFVRIVPISWHNWIALRVDVLVCANGCTSEALINGPDKISDDQLTASSKLDNEHGAFRGRLNTQANGLYGGAWTARYNDNRQYIQANFGTIIQMTGVATQGREDMAEWVKQYTLSYTQDGRTWFPYNEFTRNVIVLQGNWDQNSVRKHNFKFPIIGRAIRLWPKTYQTRISLRWEVYGCPGPDSGLNIGCFADSPQNRDLSYEPYTDPSVGMWPPMCIHHCFNKGYYYAGIQAQYKCFCGNTYGRYGPAHDCTQKCFPLDNYHCGGPSSNMIYTTGLTPRFKVCQPDWTEYGDHCFLLMLDLKSWDEARRECNLMGADLATVNGQPVQDLIYSLIMSKTANNVWIGMNDKIEESIFEWAAGEPVKFTNWNINQPRSPQNSDQDCVMIANMTGGWQDEDCNSQYQYVCMADKHGTNKTMMTTPHSMGCDPGWVAYRWSCYLVIDMTRTFQASQQACYTNSANLVRIEDRVEQSYLSSILGSRNGTYWIDVADNRNPGVYTNSDGNPSIYYTNWAPNAPAAQGQCVAMGTGAQGGLWYAIPCNTATKSICEKTRRGYTTPAPPSTTTATVPCPDGWIDIGDNKCYQVNLRSSNRRLPYADASHDCMNQGAKLISVHDPLTVHKLVSYNSSFFSTYWTGLTAQKEVNNVRVFSWADGSPLDFTDWASGQPNTMGGRNLCVFMLQHAAYKWIADTCHDTHNWICEITRGTTPTPRTTLPPAPTNIHGRCGSLTNYVYYKGHCYYVSDGSGNNGKSWREARRACQADGADLVSINSVLEQRFIVTQLENITTSTVWLGFNEIDSLHGYQWSDGSVPQFVNWNPGEPNDWFGPEDCVKMVVRNGYWDDAHCASKAGYICEKTLGTTPKPSNAAPINGNCPPGFSAFHNRCYRLFTELMTWNSASTYCQRFGKGFYIASINNIFENAFVTTLIYGKSITPWIGLRNIGRGQFIWTDNHDVTYTNWDVKEPDGGRSTLCTKISGYLHNTGKWADISCSENNAFVCETTKSTAIATPEPIPNPCDQQQGFKPFGHDCFLYVPQKLNWTNADSYCQSRGGYLATIADAFEQDFIFLFINNVTAKSAVWIGLHKDNQGAYTWTQPLWPVTYTAWRAGQPSHSGNGGCVSADSTGKWADIPCSFTLPFICKITTAQPPASPPPPNAQCPDGWVIGYNGTECYQFNHMKQLSYLDATLDCQNKGATVVSIHDIRDNLFIVQTIKSKTTQVRSVWISLHKSTGGFQWTDGSPVQFMYWDDHQPSGQGSSCVELQTWNGKWNDIDCSLVRGYVCQQKAVADVIDVTMPEVPPSIQTSPPVSPTKGPSPAKSTISSGTPKPLISTGTPKPVTPHVTPFPNSNSQTTPSSPRNSSPLGPTSSQPGGVTGQQHQSLTGNKSKKLAGGDIAGIVIAVVIVVALATVGFLFWRRKSLSSPSSDVAGFDNSVYQYNSKLENGSFSASNEESDT